MPEFQNPNNYTVHLPGPDGKVIKLKSRQKANLPEYFEQYCQRGFITKIDQQKSNLKSLHKSIQGKIKLVKPPTPQRTSDKIETKVNIKTSNEILEERKKLKEALARTKRATLIAKHNKTTGKIVGKVKRNVNPTDILLNNLVKESYSISNGVGVGILSYNRFNSIKRCIDSILKNTDLGKVTVFVSDDSSDDQRTIEYLDKLSASNASIVVIKNDVRLGIAGNTNRLLRCLSRFKYGILLNDDVEIMSSGWADFYVEAMKKTSMHHFIYREPNVYGAKLGTNVNVRGLDLRVVDEKPHGAVLAFTKEMVNKIGYFDESYGIYGMEHVDWSTKVYESGIQPKGYFDVRGSERFFKLHNDPSSVMDRKSHLNNARKLFENRTYKVCQPTEATNIDSVTYVIPVRDIGRSEAVKTVVNNIKAQKFPNIQIILVEQDDRQKVKIDNMVPIDYHLVRSSNNFLFNKSQAFNYGVTNALHNILILHDADILVQDRYTKTVYDRLKAKDACHLGYTVIYADEPSSRRIESAGIVDEKVRCDRIVEYFEGGSIACHKNAYWNCGGFNEDFYGYGCEDCDFFARLSASCNWCEDRIFDFLHIWHSRVTGWNDHHEKNRSIEDNLKRLTIIDRIKRQYTQLSKLGYRKYVNESEFFKR